MPKLNHSLWKDYPATVHRLLHALVNDGLVCRVPGTRHYSLGPLAFTLGLAAAPYFDPGRPTQARLAALAQALRGTVYLKLRSGVESVCVSRHDGAGPDPSLMLDVGGRRPLCLTAGGVNGWWRLGEEDAVHIRSKARHATA